MYVLNPDPPKPRRITAAPGVRMLMKPPAPANFIHGKRAGRAAAAAGGDSVAQEEAYTIAFAAAGVAEWAGVGDPAGKIVAPSAENVSAFLRQCPGAYEVLDREYVTPAVLAAIAEEEEKNGSSRSRNGTSAGATRGRASAGTARRGAKRAPTTSTPAKRRTAKPSGK